MQSNDTTTTPPVELIKWWLSKTQEEREVFLQNPTTSEKVRQNIQVIESFSKEHSYFVACETNLDIFPLPPLSKCPLRGWEYGIWLPCLIHNDETYGGRYTLSISQKEKRRREALHIIKEISTRIQVLLRDYSLRLKLPTQLLSHNGNNCLIRISNIMVEVLKEASMAAIYRLGLVDALENIEKEKLVIKKTTNGLQQQEKQEEYNREILDIIPKPIGACRSDAYGCLGLWMLLSSHNLKRSNLSKLSSSYSMKRSREGNKIIRQSTSPLIDNNNNNSDNATELNYWRLLRKQFAPLCDSKSFRDENDIDNNESIVAVPHVSPVITITSTDMRFGINKVLKKYLDFSM